MIDFNSLDPETRCVALVGEFLRRWSELENALNTALAVAMKLDDTMRLILSVNMQFRDKIHTLRTIVDTSSMSADEKSKYKDRLQKIADAGPLRNRMAHENFSSDKDGKGVVFFQVKAKGNFSNPEIIWSVAEFLSVYGEMEEFKNETAEFITALSKSQFTLGDYDDGESWWFNLTNEQPMRSTSPSVLQLRLAQQILSNPDSDLPSQKKVD